MYLPKGYAGSVWPFLFNSDYPKMIKASAGAYILVCSVLWMLPLFRLLHVESSAVLAFVSFFVAGISGLSLFKKGESVRSVIQTHLALLLIPLLMLTLSLLWQPNCEYVQGLTFFLLFPVITVLFSVSLAFAIYRSGIKRKYLVHIVLGLFICIAGPLYDIGFHSQFFTYNHVFGGVMGPIYDEEVTIRSGLVVFRGLSLLWAVLFLFIGSHFRANRSLGPSLRILRAGAILGIGAIYLFSARLNINSPSWYIEEGLRGHLSTEHFDIYYDPSVTNPFLLYKYEHDHEYRYAYFKEKLGIDVNGRIKSFIYPDPLTKERYTGARFTNVAPVWLATPQLHVYADAFDQVFAHELVHVFSREFGLPLINASVSVGLVEGLAVALEPSEGRPTPHDQVITAAIAAKQNESRVGSDIRERVEGSLSPFGFWTGRGAVSYTTMGSFVQFLMDTYGVDRIMDVYAYSNFEEVYGKSPRQLTLEWEAYLNELPVVPRVTHDYVTRRFSVPSLFERRCPHHVPPAVVKHRESMAALLEADTTRALRALTESLQNEPMYQPAIETWAQIYIGLGQPDSVIARIERLFNGEAEQYRTPLMWMRYGDAQVMQGERDAAMVAYDRAKDRLPLYLHDQIGFIELRKALIDYPELLAILLEPNPYEEKIKRLRTATSDISLQGFLEAILHDIAENQQEAREALEALDINMIPNQRADVNAIKRYYRIKKAHVFFRTGGISEALEEAEILEEELTQIGALPEAAFYADFASKMHYISRALKRTN